MAPASGHGLTTAEAARRLELDGRNEIARAQPTPRWRVFARQFASPVIGLLIAAAVVSGVLGDLTDAIAIAAILILDAVVGFLQEARAERAALALRSLTAPRARVLRDGRAATIPAAEIVPGDLLLLEAGDLVAADARVVEAHRLTAVEAALTGESMPVDKDPTPVALDARLAERRDHVFAGTAIAAGTGTAEVIATGMATELGRVAHLLATAHDSTTPLQQRLARISRTLMVGCLAIVALIGAMGVARGMPLFDVLLSAVSLAVAAVPEGLPAIITVALAVGVQRMARRNVLVRRLHAVETLGCATVICSDKTGTLTTGAMRVRELWGADRDAVLDTAAACCDAELPTSGDPTELAILIAAAERGIARDRIEATRPRLEVIPFDPSTKQMAIRRSDGWHVKGAIEAVIPRCATGTDGAMQAASDFANRGLRVLAIARGSDPEALDLAGIIGIADPPRPEAIQAIAHARAAGIRTVMITGDHGLTARAIASELGIDEADVHARATPEDKLALVRDWKQRGDVVAMTGDGVNDAPALREADVGIAMGRGGTEVTREASDIVLADDNFASIVAGIHEGRGIFENIRKTVVYLLAGNASELGVMLVAGLAGWPLPLLPIHLLWINLITDGLPALALVIDPPDPDTMEKPARRPDEPLLGRAEWRTVVLAACVEASLTLGVYYWALGDRGVVEARTLAFSVLVFAELFRAFTARSATKVLWEVGAWSNLQLIAVIAVSAGFQIAVLEMPWARALFDVSPLGFTDVAFAVALGLVPVTVLELVKLGRRWLAEFSPPGGRRARPANQAT